ncbi:Short-chain dehydrogenase/reductase family protein [Mycena sanguinolenta]|uniref:Short-chain dehydrogenase/reductase family protein n=1 Tax=Mycena sanguinolenta TaxID=230812 RepID=A0A8H6YF73_9AGAR|nr:Short-chain dehydrogenase/reductase family protein [Mycena sanguinolenta]
MSHSTFSFNTTAEEVATAFADYIRGKNVLVTGCSIGGIGHETARVVAKHANLVIITGHNSDRLKLAQEAIKKEIPSANIRPLILDLSSSLSAVRKAAAEVNLFPEPLHVLIHNAAANVEGFKLTVDNLETQMATNHVGPFLFTKLIAPKLLAARTEEYTPRVVSVSSGGHILASGVNFDTLVRPDPALYAPMDAYAQSKSANILCAIELTKRAGGSIHAYSLAPGRVFTSLMQKGDGTVEMQKLGILGPDGQPLSGKGFKTIPQGAATTVVAAFDPSLNGELYSMWPHFFVSHTNADTPGAYLSDCVVANQLVAPHSSDLNNAERLWVLTEQIINEPFVF